MACIRTRRNRLVLDFYDQNGKRRWKTLPKNTTKAQARKALRQIEDKIDKGSYAAPKKVPGFLDVADMWLESVKLDVRAYTHKQYVGYVENHLKPYYGITRITRIDYGSVERFIQDRRKATISISTLRKIKTAFGAIMGYACHKRYIDHNPVKDIKSPKDKNSHKEEKEIAVLTPDQIRTLLDTTTELKYKTLYMTAVMTGMREGENLGLKWDDIDWVAGQIHVKRNYHHGSFYKPKSKASRRKIDLAPQLITQLKTWQLACPPNKLDLVFPTRNGKPIDGTSMFRNKFLPALKTAKIPKIRFHALRHTFASLLIDQGENPKYIQRQMGHSSINITFDIYGHLMKDTNEEAARKLGDTIFGEDGQNSLERRRW